MYPPDPEMVCEKNRGVSKRASLAKRRGRVAGIGSRIAAFKSKAIVGRQKRKNAKSQRDPPSPKGSR